MQTIKRVTAAEQILTKRQFEIFLLYGQGKAPTEIGKILFISHKTVSTHRNTIKEKMGFKSTYALLYYAIKLDLFINHNDCWYIELK